MTADDVYVDPSALARLYIHQADSLKMVNWRRRHAGPLSVTHHGRAEVVNAISLALFRKEISASEAANSWNYVDEDFDAGHLIQADLLWRAALQRATELSRAYTPTLGTRSLDVLHVACALELKRRAILSFDERQQKLASAAGLKLIRL